MSADRTPRTIRSYRTKKRLRLDGHLNKWSGGDSVKFEAPPLKGGARSAEVFTLWDAHDLYLRFDIHSPRIRASVREHDGDKLWEDDGIEFLIDAQRHRTKQFLPDDFSYHINILNAVYDDRGTAAGDPDADEKWNGKAKHIVKILDNYHYIVEVAIPWEEIGLKPQENQTTLGIDFGVNGRDPETNQYVFYDWCGLTVFHDPSGYGDIVLRGPLPRVH